ncbi:MAG: ATP-binding protein [Proteobacteria bacterium]|nr:ATP-binding protein [Pseudomonadota bacterium]
MLKKIASNLPRAGLLAIPSAGAALEKAIYGPLDDKSKENERKELFSALNELGKSAEFAAADTINQLEILAKRIEETNENLSKTIRELNPIQIEVQLFQQIQPIIINIFNGMSNEGMISLYSKIGISQSNLINEEDPEILGKQLLDSTAQIGKISELIHELEFLFPDSIKIPEKDNGKAQKKKIVEELASASRSLLTWPNTIGEGKWLERKEVSLIEKKISSNETSTTLILGKPGTGKSALLSFIANMLIEKDFPVLGIKADMLPKSVTDLSDLQKYLQLSYPIHESLLRCYENKPPILVIDQLDALSELVDRNSDRLNVLLDLIQTISNTNRVHVISSCRWFEYQHDVRLTTIDAEKIDLTLPSWEDVEIVLKESGFLVDNFSDETKALCSVPLHLKILLDLKFRDADAKIPSSLQALLENIWQQRVVTGTNVSDKIDIIELLSNKMAEDEELWVARALADSNPDAFQELQRANILKLDDSGLRIGFVHQTYFDFARARSFATGRIILSDFVIQKQDGLFVRPILLRTLAYLREASPKAYSKELTKLWETGGLRSHIKNLLVEYIGCVENPNEIELSCLLPLFEDDRLKYKTLLSIAGSPGWFNAIKDTILPIIMCEGAEFAHVFIPIFSRALTFAKEDVLRLLETNWLNDSAYDEYMLNLLTHLKDWNQRSVDIVIHIARRHESHWIPYLAEIVSQNRPELAPKIVRADFDRRWNLALKEETEYKPPPPPPPEADETEKEIYELTHNKIDIIEKLLSHDKGWHDLSIIAETSPKAFIDSIWPWFIKVVKRIVYKPHPFVTSYQEDHSLGTYPERDGVSEDQPISALTKAIVTLSSMQAENFIEFFYENKESPFLAVQRLLSIGLLQIVKTHPKIILEYLLSDPKRMVIGDFKDQHKYTKRLISAVVPYLDEDEIKLLEDTAINWHRYHREDPEWTAEEKFNRGKWHREHRLRILRAFPEEYSSEQLTRLRVKEERAFPKLIDWDSRIGDFGCVGSSMSQEQMLKAEDDHIINLFNTLTDDTEWDHPKRGRDLIGGSVQASREFAAFAEKNPERASKIILKFTPEKQERPAGMGIGGLSKSEYSTEDLLKIIETLVDKGFSANEFRHEVARGLQKRANKDKGLPNHIINLLKTWYKEETYPALSESEKNNKKREPQEDSILWGHGGIFSLPGGRDIYLEAIALGCLLRKPPDHEQFAEFIEGMLQHEKYPKIWQIAFRWMKYLFNWDKNRATKYYDHVINNISDVIESKIGIIEYAEIIHMVPDKKIVQEWISLIGNKDSEFRKQAFGEFLFYYNLINPDDEWCKEQLYQILNDQKFFREQRGVAFAASRHWQHTKHQAICTEVITKLSSTKDEITQKAISLIFLYGENVLLNKNMKRIISAILPNDGIIIKSAERLIEGVIDNTAIEPELIGYICSRVIKVGKDEIKSLGSRYSMVAEPIVSIALTLHRMPPPYRKIGLNLFEELIESDIPYARQALDILDRKPIAAQLPMRLRRRRKRREK